MPLLRITDETGDTRIPWEDKDLEAVAFQFSQFSAKGYAAFADGQKVKAFAPEANEIIMIKPVVGG